MRVSTLSYLGAVCASFSEECSGPLPALILDYLGGGCFVFLLPSRMGSLSIEISAPKQTGGLQMFL